MPAEASLSTMDRLLLVVPMAAGLLLGFAPWLVTVPFANLMGYGGSDRFFYWLAGSAALGYGVSLVVGIREGSWRGLRFVVIAALVFNLVTLYACAVEAFGGTATSFVYVVAAAALVQVVITIFLLFEHRGAAFGPPNIPGGRAALAVIGIAIIAASFFGTLGAFLPVYTTHFFGYAGTEVFLYRLAGAATLGYAIMGLFNSRSRNWKEVRLPVLMAIVFNGVSFLAAIRAILQRAPHLTPLDVAVATLAVSAPMTYRDVTTRIID
jgi:hypothetical protein